MDKYVTYFRVSTKRQGVSGLGLDAQENAVKRFISSNGGNVIATFTDVESGKNNAREGLDKAIRACLLSNATLLIAKLDRLSRNAAFLFTLRDSGVDFKCADMPRANTLTIGIMATLAQYEREVISERTKAALAQAKANGKVLGNKAVLLANRNTDTTKARQVRDQNANKRNNHAKAVINEIIAQYETKPTLQAIADELNAKGYTTSRGFDWKPTSVNRVLIR